MGGLLSFCGCLFFVGFFLAFVFILIAGSLCAKHRLYKFKVFSAFPQACTLKFSLYSKSSTYEQVSFQEHVHKTNLFLSPAKLA